MKKTIRCMGWVRMESKFLFGLLAAILTGICGWLPCQAAFAGGQAILQEDEEKRTVRVGYYEGDIRFQDGFSEQERKSGYAYEYYQSLALITGWSYEYVYGSREEVMEQLINGDVDIVAGVYKTDKRMKEVIFSEKDMGLSGAPRYFAVNKNRPELLSELNSAQDKLLETYPDFELGLWQKYYNYNTWNQTLTERETAWLADAGLLRMGYVKNNLPFSDQSENGEPEGVAGVLFDEISSILKTPIEPVCYDTVEKMEEGLVKGEIDAAFPIYSDMWLTETKGLLQTEAFINERVAVAYQGKYRSNLMDVVALSETGLGQRYYIKNKYPDAKTVMYSSRTEAFDGIIKGEANCMIGCSSIIQHFLAEHTEYENFNMAYLDSSEEFSMAVSREDSTLAWILNKVIKHLDSATLTDAIIKYSHVEPKYGFKDLVEHYSLMLISVLIVFFAVLLAVFISYRKKTRQFNAKQAQTNAALEVALDAANTANAAKSAFLSNMSHDIRTPMNAITGFATLLLRDAENPEKVREYTKKIASSSHHLLSLINDVLDMSKIEAGKATLNLSGENMAEIMDEIDAIIRPQVKAKRQKFEICVKDVVHEDIMVDKMRLSQILLNLLSNAVKYTNEEGHIKMTVQELPQRSQTYANYRILVEDNGYGMNPEYIDDIFDAFSREESTASRKIRGTGLGMAITKNLVDMMGGRISVESEEGKGSVFTVELELRLAKSTLDRNFFSENGITRMLVVDDQEDICQYVKAVMEGTGIDVDYATNGFSAISMAKEAIGKGLKYHVILLDWKMPGMDGVKTAQCIRQEISEDVPLIVLTSYDFADVEDSARKAGIDAILHKPFFVTAFVHKLDEILNGGMEAEQASDDEHGSVFKGKHVLVVEDNMVNAEIMTAFLKNVGASYDVCQNGKEAVETFAASRPGQYQLILMDVQMPIMNGYEATRAIRESGHEGAEDIPIIAMTANAFSEDIRSALESGMNAHVSKPLNLKVLEETVRQVLEECKEAAVSDE